MKDLVYLITYVKRILLLLGLYTTSRIFFYYNNIDSFSSLSLFEFIEGLRFDISALAYINIPLIILLFLPHNLRRNKHYHTLTNWLFYGVNIPFILLNNIDIEYFRFTQKRSTIDFLQLMQLGSDAKYIIPQYMKDYWPITLFSIVQIYLLLKIKSIPTVKFPLWLNGISKQLIILLFAVGLFIVSARGGLQLKPIKPINAGELSGSQNTSLILNTPFCILHSLDEKELKAYQYYSKQELATQYSPIIKATHATLQKQNIVILIMESYSKEFVGFYNEGESHTPFLDSLMQHSLVFTNAYANGLKSIEALPAITASIPTLMDNPFITSDHAQNSFESLASILNKEDYNTSFYHGGSKGTMGFYSYSRKAGFTDYFGLEEYSSTADFDGSWGVFDGPFMQYFSNHLKEKQQPFFTTFFSLSSHPPYVLPEGYKSNTATLGILETIGYSDYAMHQFFNSIREEDWIKNTIFIITADHTSGVRYNKKYKNKLGRYAIPMVIFKGDNSLQGVNKNVVQQIDIMPTVLDLLNYNKGFFAFGKSMLTSESWALSYLANKYYFISENGFLINKGEDYQLFKDWDLTKKLEVKEEDIRKLKAIKQQYNKAMIENKLLYEN
jgi:hypothetical protein